MFVVCLQEEQGSASPAPASRSLSRKDATAFVRAARRYGLKARLPAIAAEVGGAVEEAGPQQQLSLWRALVDGCRRALEMGQVAEQMHEAKVSGDSICECRG
jgi:chromodomain-helicase-DNA-binding protein 1